MWSAVKGHTVQIEQLKKLLRDERIPHAILLSGMEGIGKKMVAFGFAQAILRCGNIHPDLHFVIPDGQSIKIEQIRELKHKASLHSFAGGAKIFILDDADAMTESASNALLKILEEPPADTFLILISSRPNMLLPTIRSRCQIITFQPLPVKELENILREKGIHQETEFLSRFAQGSLKRALKIDVEKLKEIRKQWEALKSDPQTFQLLQQSEEWNKEEEECRLALEIGAFDFYEQMQNRDKAIEPILKKWEITQTALTQIEYNANKRLLLENWLMQVTR
ncbi:MAG: DNA polymerase III subunit [Deltaproteobacteria bacterium]|nr:DNA polymerase III subunit [Deltaproteobacteria bacterium]